MVAGGCRNASNDVQGLERHLTPFVLAIKSDCLLILDIKLVGTLKSEGNLDISFPGVELMLNEKKKPTKNPRLKPQLKCCLLVLSLKRRFWFSSPVF